MTAQKIQTIAQERMFDVADDYSNYRISAPRAIITHLFYFTIGLIAAAAR